MNIVQPLSFELNEGAEFNLCTIRDGEKWIGLQCNAPIEDEGYIADAEGDVQCFDKNEVVCTQNCLVLVDEASIMDNGGNRYYRLIGATPQHGIAYTRSIEYKNR